MNEVCWSISESELVGLTPERARDLVVDCFYFAQHQTFARSRLKVGATHLDEASLRSNVLSAVKLAFGESGGDFEHPSLESLQAAIAVLARKAEAWGTPPDIIRHHSQQVKRMFERMAAGA